MFNITEIITLIFEFFKIGLFSVGGGLATLPFLYELANKYDWLTTEQLMDLIGVSESTPGALGVNMATYVGYTNSGFIGGIVATLSLVFPSLIIVTLISKFIDKFQNNIYVTNVFNLLRPAVVGLIANAGIGIVINVFGISSNNISYINIIGFFLFSFLLLKFPKIHVITFIFSCAIIGIIIGYTF